MGIQVQKSDAIWNYASLAVMGISGVLFNLVIARFYDASALGVFNQSFAFYIVAAQFSALGIHYSVLSKTAVAQKNEVSSIVFWGFFLTTILGLMVGTGLYLLRHWIGQALDSAQVAESLFYVAPAVTLFGVNKTLLNALNGLQRMRAFAIGQSMRYLGILFALYYLAARQVPAEELASVFLYAETVLLLYLLVCLWPSLLNPFPSEMLRHCIAHFSFGLKGVFSGVLVEFNSRVDVLMIGFFLSDSVVGIYSFAAMFAEGFYQLLVVLRNLVNPQLAQSLQQGRLDDIRKSFRKFAPKIYLSTFGLALLCLGVFFFYLQLAQWNDTISLQILAILLAGIFLSSAFVPFDGIFIQAQRPDLQSLFMVMVVMTNATLNMVLIPIWGPLGAALATAISFVGAAIYLNLLASWKLQVRLI